MRSDPKVKLFTKGDLRPELKSRKDNAKNHIIHEGDQTILTANGQQYIAQVVEKYSVDPPVVQFDERYAEPEGSGPDTFREAIRHGRMTEQPESGELLVGSYLRLIEQCELVMYNQRSHEEGNQLEIDVIGADNTEEGEQVVYTCEVVTHIDGLLYPGTPDTDRWAEYGGDGYQNTLERLWRKFNADREYVTDLFDADSCVFQFWSPVVRGNRDEKYLLTGLYDMADEFEDETGAELELVINEEYTERMEALREKAGQTEKDYGELGFRILQILEHLR